MKEVEIWSENQKFDALRASKRYKNLKLVVTPAGSDMIWVEYQVISDGRKEVCLFHEVKEAREFMTRESEKPTLVNIKGRWYLK